MNPLSLCQMNENLLMKEFVDMFREQVSEIIQSVKENADAVIARVNVGATSDTPLTSPVTSRKASTISLQSLQDADTRVILLILSQYTVYCYDHFPPNLVDLRNFSAANGACGKSASVIQSKSLLQSEVFSVDCYILHVSYLFPP